jgi:PAS domain S-box-containing protein
VIRNSTAAPAARTRRARGAGAASSRKLAAIVESSADAIVACDLLGRIETWNDGATRLLGLAPSEILGRPLLEVFHAGDAARVAALLAEAGEGRGSETTRVAGLTRAGQKVSLSIRVSPVRERGRVRGVSLIARDISARKLAEEELQRSRAELEARESALREALVALRASHEQLKSTQLQLIQAAKLESVGRLAAGVAHEVKNPLAVILASTELLLVREPLSPAQVKALRGIQEAVQRASTVIGGLLSYSAATTLHIVQADVHAVLEQALLLVGHALVRGRIRVVRQFDPRLPPLPLDVTKIEQVFINLFMNAIDAMPDGGTLTIRTRRSQITAEHEGAGVRRTDALRIGQTMVLAEIEDTGVGIPAEQLAKVFDPFFTTKPTGKGSGLGLAVSRTIAALHGGTVWIRNLDHGGARATVVLGTRAR